MPQAKSKLAQRIFLVAIFFVGFAVIFLLSRMKHDFDTLPYFYPEDIIQTTVNGQVLNDTIWLTIPSFSFV